ncbi:type VI secretion system baseplate subunit TssG [Buttiauxella ferragutiae]|uniref:type VI secretion system baseplate subunit TssG n=1 Tax=Buttiauxella ferragutiae TaxID=82989 RepID=UPI003525E1FD
MAVIPNISRFHFYQQIRLLLRRLRDGKTPDAALLDEKLQLVSTLSLNAPNGQIEKIYPFEDGTPLQVVIPHNGLTGAMGALPTAYSEWMIERQYRYGDHSAKAFIDLFGHRLYCLDYLAWQKHHLYALAESQLKTPLQTEILGLTGLLTASPASTLAHYACLFASPVRSMANLERLLSRMFSIPAQIVPFTGSWRAVDKNEQCQLGNPDQTLNTAPVIGHVRQEVHAHFDVILGPMSPETSRRFVPQGSAWKEVWLRVRDYVGPAMDFSVSLVISSANSTPRTLGMSTLGLDLCLGSNALSHQHQVRLPAPTV